MRRDDRAANVTIRVRVALAKSDRTLDPAANRDVTGILAAILHGVIVLIS